MTLLATCYARFSSQEQSSGNSLERQFKLTTEFATSRNWDVSPDRCISDEGRSAFDGTNRAEGSALFRFEQQAEQGLYRNGHALVVEHLDRVSRQGFQEVYDFLNKLTSRGVTVATVDGSTIYEPYKRIDMAEIMKVLIKSEVAREESEKKRNRQLYIWEKKLEQVRKGDRTAITKLVPEWVEVHAMTREMRLNEYRAGIVQEIFQLCIDGYGSPAIANMLNARGEETWAVYSKDDPKGHYKAGDKRAGRGWTISYINRLLQNPAVTGEYRPMQRARSATLAVAKGERYLDYYPKAIDPAVFAQANAARQDRRNKGGKLWAQQVNLFSGLARCSVCGDKMGYVGTRKAGRLVKGTSGTRKPIQYMTGTDTNYLMCNSARRNYRCTNKKRIRYEHLERAVLDNLLHLALDDTHFEIADRVTELHVEIADRENRLSEKNERLGKAFSANKRAKLYQTIQTAYVIAAELMKPGNKAVLDELLAQHGLKRDKRKGSNPWVATVNLLFGTWVKQKGAKARAFKADRSAWKYAASFRFFSENHWPADEVAERLTNYQSKFLGKTQFGRGLVATQKEDAYDHRENDADVREDSDLLNRFVTYTLPAAEVGKGNLLINDGVERQFVALWGIVIDGKIHVYGELPNRSAGVRAHATRAARELDRYMNGPHQKGRRTPKLLPPNVVNEKGWLVRKDGMTIVDIEALSVPHTAETTLTEETPKLDAESPQATIEVPLPIKNSRHLEAATGRD